MWAPTEPQRRAELPTPSENEQAGRSWLDRLITVISRLPGPAWAFYLVVTAAFVGVDIGLTWLGGSVHVGFVDSGRVLNDLLTVYGLAFVHFLTVTARRALEEFRPALGTLETSHDRLERQLTSTPWLASVIPVVLAFAFTALSFSNDPAGWGIRKGTSIAVAVFTVGQGSIFIAFFFVFVTFAIRQLIVVVRLHRAASAVSLYSRESNSAFSRLSLRTSVGLVLPVYLYAFVAVISGWSFAKTSVFEVVALAAVVLTSAALFVLPLNGMHRRLVREKSRLVTVSNLHFETAAADLHSLMHSGKFDAVDGLSKAMTSLVVERDTLKKLSTWPWEPDTLRGFLSSIGLPIVLWLITTVLSRLFV
jgi:hypothetical protein